MQVSAAPHPAGITLTRNGYYTIPSLDQLADMVDDDGKCLVSSFTIGRTGKRSLCASGDTYR